MTKLFTYNVRIYKKTIVSGIVMDTPIKDVEGVTDVRVNEGCIVLVKGEGGVILAPEPGTFIDIIAIEVKEDNGSYQ